MNTVLMLGGSRGDVQPYLALGLGLRRLGHRVTVAAPGDFADLIEPHGLKWHPIPFDVRAVVARQLEDGGANPLQFVLRSRRAAGAALEQVAVSYAEAAVGAELVVYSPVGMLGREAAVAMGVPVIGALPAPFLCSTQDYQHSFFPTPRRKLTLPEGREASIPWRAYNRLSYPLMNQLGFQLLRSAANRGLVRTRSVIPNIRPYSLRGPFSEITDSSEPVLHGYSKFVLPEPPEWRKKNLHVTGYWQLSTEDDWEPPPGLRQFIEAGEPPVYVGFGSMKGGGEEELTRLVVRALSLVGRRGILLSGWGGLGLTEQGARLPGTPDEVLIVEDAPHQWLFPRVAAAVHHGGAGTTAASLRAGTPTVVVPFFADQTFWGARVAGLGVGPRPISRSKLTVSNLAEAIRYATTDRDVADRARVLGQAIRGEDGVANAVEYIDRYTAPG